MVVGCNAVNDVHDRVAAGRRQKRVVNGCCFCCNCLLSRHQTRADAHGLNDPRYASITSVTPQEMPISSCDLGRGCDLQKSVFDGFLAEKMGVREKGVTLAKSTDGWLRCQGLSRRTTQGMGVWDWRAGILLSSSRTF